MSDLALQLIAENKRTKDNFLDLGNCGLSEIPAEVADLVWLEGLSFASEWWEWDGREYRTTESRNTGDSNEGLSDLTPLAGLSGLKTLVLATTQVSDLAPLAELSALQTLDLGATEVTDLAPLAGLSAMRMLDVSETEVSDLAPLAGLCSLQRLNVANTEVTDLSPLAGLFFLQQLDVANTEVTDLAPLAGLSPLQTLDVSSTLITDLAPLCGLSGLQMLDVSGTQVTDLSPLIELIRRGCPVQWRSGLLGGDGIYVENCPITDPPPEIVRQGNDAILRYFVEREVGGVDHLYEAKLIILGEGGAGKTSLLRRLYQFGQSLPTEIETTRSISTYRHEFKLNNGRTFRLNIWDFGGQAIYHATHQFFMTHRSLYLLVDDTRKDYKSVSDEGFTYWLELIDVFGGHSPTLIFQNEKDGRSKAIDFEGIKRRYDNVMELYAGNLETTDAVDKLRDGIEYYASHLSHIGEELPARWIKVRADIEQLAAQQPYVPVEKYFEIYSRHMEFDQTKALHLSRYLHDLGVFLHFQDDPLLAHTVILQNQWATEAVFRVLDDETVKAKLGCFNSGDCQRLWPDFVYAGMHSELLALMQRFELCYELRDSKPTTWLVPQLLPPAKPTALADWGKPEDLALRYRYDFLPKGMISRLTVRLHRFVRNPEMAWVTGALFERDSTAVLVEILASGSEIELRARGPERQALLSVIASDLDALNDSFQGLRDKVDKRIPCNCKSCRAMSAPEFFDQKALLRRKRDNRVEVECPRSFEMVNVLELLDGIRLDGLPGRVNELPVPTAPPELPIPREVTTTRDLPVPRVVPTPPESPTTRRIRIFLASSAELRGDRDEFDRYFRQHNDRLLRRGFYLKIVRWENFLDAMSETRLQDEYNKAIRNCYIFVCLFFTKIGKFTEEEFDVAHRQFKNSGKPIIYTFFKKAVVDLDTLPAEDYDSLRALKTKIKSLGHFRTNYDNIDGLKLHFHDQLDMILDEYDFR